jgi:hypothetical protein
MISDLPLVSKRFPRAAKYNPDWVLASVSGAANPLWLSEWLAAAMDLRPGMRVLDLGCGRASPLVTVKPHLTACLLRPESPCRRGPLDLAIETVSN